MAVQTTFKRYETKYMLTKAQKEAVLSAMSTHMALDLYGRTTIRNLYYDTDDYRLVRHSIDKPMYKEKLRVRSYEAAGETDNVFVELKKKYDAVVYKRRLVMQSKDAEEWLTESAGKKNLPEEISNITDLGKNSQIGKEIAYFRDYYKTLVPRVYISYEREAYYDLSGSDFRITFDENIMARTDRLSLAETPEGNPLLPEGMTLMEIKCSGGYPLWLVQVLSKERIYKTSFSKYGTAYEQMILPEKFPPLAQKRETRKNENPAWVIRHPDTLSYATVPCQEMRGGRKYA